MTEIATNERYPLLVFADDWGRHPSSCQHLIRRLRDDWPVLWVNSVGTRRIRANALTFRRGLEKLRGWGEGLKQVSDRMWVVDLPMIPGLGSRALRLLNRRLVSWRLQGILDRLGMEAPVILSTLPYVGWLIRDLPRRGVVYYCTDDYSHWPSADGETLREADREFTDQADLILAASRALHAGHNQSGRSRYFPHGVDLAHLARARDKGDLPGDLEAIPGPRVGFFGLIYEKLDFDLLEGLARRFPSANLVMIGSVAWRPDGFVALPNVHFLGPKPYEDLPRHIAGLDVLLLPYLADDPMIRQSGPLKLKECLASGKPTVSVDVPEVRPLEPHVRVASDRAMFLDLVAEALDEPAGSPLAESRVRAVEQDDWDRRSDQLRAYLLELTSPSGVAAL